MKNFKIAIVGAGVWGDTHAAIYREHPNVEPVAICDKNIEKAKALAEKYGLPERRTKYILKCLRDELRRQLSKEGIAV